MKKIDLGQSITILANVGVIVGIIFLAIEIQQNNQLLRAEAIGAVLETRMSRNDQIVANEGVAELVTKRERGDPLTDVELTRLQAVTSRSLMGWERDYFLYREGILTEEYLQANYPVMKGAFRIHENPNVYSARRHWDEDWSSNATVGFKEFIEQCIIAECDTIPR